MAIRPPSARGEFLNAEEVALELGVSVRTVRRMFAAHEIRTHRIRRLIRVSREDFVAYLAVRRG